MILMQEVSQDLTLNSDVSTIYVIVVYYVLHARLSGANKGHGPFSLWSRFRRVDIRYCKNSKMKMGSVLKVRLV